MKAAGPWPPTLEFPDGFSRYLRSKYTQEIAVTDERDRITPVFRLKVKSKWHQSGGLEGIDNWRSDLYKNQTTRSYIDNISVLNSLGFMQNNRGYKRNYADGASFMDVLSHNDSVFEVRKSEKRNGKWNFAIIYRDKESRPPGYEGLNQTCVSCHSEAGTGGYADGLVPGGDFILSDPFPELERE